MIGPEATRRALERRLFKSRWNSCRWQDIRPLSIRVEDDIAIVHFYGHWVCMDTDQVAHFLEQKRLEIFKRTESGWIVIGGMNTPSGAEEF